MSVSKPCIKKVYLPSYDVSIQAILTDSLAQHRDSAPWGRNTQTRMVETNSNRFMVDLIEDKTG